MRGACGQGEVGWRRRTDRPADAPAPWAPDAPRTTQMSVAAVVRSVSKYRCFADVVRPSNAQETPRKQLEPAGTKLATVRAAGATARSAPTVMPSHPHPNFTPL